MAASPLNATIVPYWLWPIVAAPFVGSFLTVVIARFRLPRAIVWGRSACGQCGHRLDPFDLVPILSWMISRGRCRHCGGSIGLLYLGIELAAVVVAIWSAALSSGWPMWVSCGFGWILIALAVIDARHQILPDFLTLPLIPAGLAVAAGAGSIPAENIVGAIGGFAFVIAVRQAYWMLRHREGIGIGDAKLLSAAGAWLSWQGLPSVVLIAACSGLALVLLRHRRRDIFLDEPVPFGAYLCFGTWIVWLYGPIG
jgi:leader peptidase (prepilin peptidase) / N-methyltransferase